MWTQDNLPHTHQRKWTDKYEWPCIRIVCLTFRTVLKWQLKRMHRIYIWAINKLKLFSETNFSSKWYKSEQPTHHWRQQCCAVSFFRLNYEYFLLFRQGKQKWSNSYRFSAILYRTSESDTNQHQPNATWWVEINCFVFNNINKHKCFSPKTQQTHHSRAFEFSQLDRARHKVVSSIWILRCKCFEKLNSIQHELCSTSANNTIF